MNKHCTQLTQYASKQTGHGERPVARATTRRLPRAAGTFSFSALMLATLLALAGCGGGGGGSDSGQNGGGNGNGGGGNGNGGGGNGNGGGGNGNGGNGGGNGADELLGKVLKTEVGPLLGRPREVTIGAAGGVVESMDGRARLIVPAGALAAPTAISIQPFVNTLPAGVGEGWRLLPNGLQFAVPATLAMQVAADTTKRNIGLAYQAADKSWRTRSDAPLSPDVEGRVLLPVHHFTDWAFYERWFLLPDQATVAVGKSQRFDAIYHDCSQPANMECLLMPLAGNANVAEWRVNGVRGGSASSGTIAEQAGVGQFTAPAQRPAQNPVSVQAVVNLPPGQGQLQLAAPVQIIGGNWQGWVQVSFEGGMPDADPQHSAQVRFRFRYQVERVISEDGGGDMSFLFLDMTTPDLSYRLDTYDKHTCAAGWEALSAQGVLDTSMPLPADSPEVGLVINADKTSKLVITAPPKANLTGQRRAMTCGGGCGNEAPSEFTEALHASGVSLAMLQGAQFDGPAGDGKTYKGNVELPGKHRVMFGMPFEIDGKYRIEWQMTRN